MDRLSSMRGYGQFCPVAKAAEIVSERWTFLVIRELIAGSTRFNELRRGVPLMSPSLLARRLRFLEECGVVRRESEAGRSHRYRLTPAGQELAPIVESLGVWGQRWVRSRLTEHDLDAGLLMWDIHRNIDVAALPAKRTVVQVTLTDAPKAERVWWLVVEHGGVELCLIDPGHEVDLYVEAGLKSLTAVWIGSDRLDAALREGRVLLDGPRDLARAFARSLKISPFARVAAAE